MKKWIYTLSLMGALAVGANADVITHETPTLVDGCYQITNAGELFGFADIVNGIRNAENPEEYSQAPQPGVCGKLVADIRVVAVDSPSDKGNHVVSDDLKSVSVPEDNHWTPMMNFSGTFDGQGHTISGLYYSGNNAGFFASLSGAKIKNLRITDSYFEAENKVGSLAANISGTTTIEGYQFIGIINTNGSETNAGGVIGSISASSELTLFNVIVEGTVVPNIKNSSGGVIGYSESNTKISFNTCYVKVLVGGSFQRSVIGDIITTEKSINLVNNSSIYCAGTGEKCNYKNMCKYTVIDDETKKEQEAANKNVSVCRERFAQSLIDTLLNKQKIELKGISIEQDENNPTKIIAHITEWKTFNEEVLEELSISQDMMVDSVDFDRVFSGKSSTIMLPFDIAPSNVKDANGYLVNFNTVPSLSYDEELGKWNATATTETAVIEAHRPYLISSVTGNIHFHGPVTLKKTTNKINKQEIQINEHEISTNDPNWTLVGTYKTMLTTSTTEGTASEYEKESNLGRIYGFVGTNVKENEDDENYTFSIGQFAKAGHNVRTREMRAYLIYKGTQIAVNPAPSLNGVTKFAPLAIAIDDLPNAIEINVTNKPIIEGEQITTFTKIVNVIKIEVPEESCDAEKCEDDITTISKPFLAQLKANKVDRWQDAMGRRLKNKPTKHGTYFKNGIPVIIK